MNRITKRLACGALSLVLAFSMAMPALAADASSEAVSGKPVSSEAVSQSEQKAPSAAKQKKHKKAEANSNASVSSEPTVESTADIKSAVSNTGVTSGSGPSVEPGMKQITIRFVTKKGKEIFKSDYVIPEEITSIPTDALHFPSNYCLIEDVANIALDESGITDVKVKKGHQIKYNAYFFLQDNDLSDVYQSIPLELYTEGKTQMVRLTIPDTEPQVDNKIFDCWMSNEAGTPLYRPGDVIEMERSEMPSEGLLFLVTWREVGKLPHDKIFMEGVDPFFRPGEVDLPAPPSVVFQYSPYDETYTLTMPEAVPTSSDPLLKFDCWSIMDDRQVCYSLTSDRLGTLLAPGESIELPLSDISDFPGLYCNWQDIDRSPLFMTPDDRKPTMLPCFLSVYKYEMDEPFCTVTLPKKLTRKGYKLTGFLMKPKYEIAALDAEGAESAELYGAPSQGLVRVKPGETVVTDEVMMFLAQWKKAAKPAEPEHHHDEEPAAPVVTPVPAAPAAPVAPLTGDPSLLALWALVGTGSLGAAGFTHRKRR